MPKPLVTSTAMVPETRGAILLVFWGGVPVLVERYNVIAWYIEVAQHPELGPGPLMVVTPVVCEDVDNADAQCIVETGPDGAQRWIFQDDSAFIEEASALAHGTHQAERAEQQRLGRRAEAEITQGRKEGKAH
jgi:hypothetical protein